MATVDGVPIADDAWIDRQLAFANAQFAALDVEWRIVGRDALPASAARVEDAAERDGFGKLVKGTVLHVFVTGQLDDIDNPGEVIRGVTWRKVYPYVAAFLFLCLRAAQPCANHRRVRRRS